MATLDDLYTFYCRRRECKPNSFFSHYLQEEYENRGRHRILETIDLSNNYVGKKGVVPVLDLAKNIKTLKKLDLSKNMLEHEQLDHLVYCLAVHPSIEEVNFSTNCLHDGSLPHILKLLEINRRIIVFNVAGNDFAPTSVALINEQLEKNVKYKLEFPDDIIVPYTGRSFRAVVDGTIESGNSGGYVYFSTWWMNPQYVMHTSRGSRVRIVMDVQDKKEARQVGFVVFLTDGTRKVIEKDSLVAESNVDYSHCYLEIKVEQDTTYAIMPYTFYPERSMNYTLMAEMCRDDPKETEGWVTLDLVDPSLDWIVNGVTGEWTSQSAGGSPNNHTWCRNSMFHIQYSGSTHAYRMASAATVSVKLTKSVDPDDNDDRHIGFDVVSPDPTGHNTPPITCKEEFVKCTCPHKHNVTVSASFVVPCASLDLFIVPSTLIPGELGGYTVTVFSTVPITLNISEFPHQWNYRVVKGLWDANNCGGTREKSMSWKNNPSVALHFDADKESRDVTLFLERSTEIHPTNEQKTDKRESSLRHITMNSLENTREGSQDEITEDAQDKKELVEFRRRHEAQCIEMSLSIVEAKSPFYRALHASDFATDVVHLAVPSIREEFYVFPVTRYAGQLGRYTLHIFSAHPFVVDGPETLAVRERQSQITQHAQEVLSRQNDFTATSNRPGTELCDELLSAHNEILRKCMATGEKFVDRDFPRGTSSLWLDVMMKTPPDFPKQIEWKRPTDVCDSVEFLPKWACDCPFPHSKRDWFASVVFAIATKPSWIQTITVGYDISEGVVRFRFFKDGKWVVVCIDDYLPFDNTMELCMGRPGKNKADFFFPLVEKAYAKLHRCYETLERKVTPEVGTAELMCQGLMDLSGFATLSCPVGRKERLSHDEQEELWVKVKNATNPDVLVALLLCGNSSGASERENLGILRDHLYPVLDARFVEGQRLVKVRHWEQDAENHWTGKWRANSGNWTETLRELLDFDEEEKGTFWLSFDEVIYYFTDLITTTVTAHQSWISSDFSDCEKNLQIPLQQGTQFALQLGKLPEGVNELEILLGLHQVDPRTTITRDKHALAKYRTPIGLAVLETEDNTVWLKNIEECDAVKCIAPLMCRDAFLPLKVNIENVSGNRKLTLVAFKGDSLCRDAPFLLSAWSGNCDVKIERVRRDQATRISGEWPKERSIGPPTSPYWRDCPQYFIYPSESTDVTLVLHQDVRANEVPKSIGFTVHKAVSCRSYLEYDPESVLLEAAVPSSPSSSFVSASVRLLGMKERRGMPYIIVPYCVEPNGGETFHIVAMANRAVKLCHIDPRLDWHRKVLHATFSLADGSVGGSPRFSSWRSSPQFALTFPLGGQGRLYIVARNNNPNDTLTEVGMMLLRGDSDWQHGQRRKLVIRSEDVVGQSEEKIDSVTLDCEIDMHPGSTLILLVFASMPYREADVTVSLYCAPAVEVEPVKEWKHVAVVEGNWNLGFTAGGGAEAYSSWINNPFIGLNTYRRTQLVALLLQYPHGPDKPLVKRAGNKKAFLPPIVVNPNNRMDIALDLNNQDGELTTIASTPYTKNSEVTLVASVSAAESLPYLFVPHTKTPQGNGDFKLFVYADSKIELFPLSNHRIPYV